MKIIPDIYRREWYFSESYSSKADIAEMVTSKSDVTKQQQGILNKFIQEKHEVTKTSLGCIHLIEHEIVTGS